MGFGKITIAAILLFCASVPAACAPTITPSGRAGLAAGIAGPSGLKQHQVAAGRFALSSWQRMERYGEPVHLYIEGDGLAWTGRSRPSSNPTPKTPVALMLAARDASPNVIYLARPCQYVPPDRAGNEACKEPAYWTGKRYSQDVVDGYMAALDLLAAQTGAAEFHITGFSGGANIAGLLAARRRDITQIRTVAGNLDNDFFTRFHNVSTMPLSLNMADDGLRLGQIPQIHFTGGKDRIVPVDLYKSYRSKTGESPCVRHVVLPGAGHTDGWDRLWPDLLSIEAGCKPLPQRHDNHM